MPKMCTCATSVSGVIAEYGCVGVATEPVLTLMAYTKHACVLCRRSCAHALDADRLGEPIFAEGECFPEEVDWMGFDYYGWGDNTSFLYSQAAFTQNLFPRIWDHQRVVPVTECTAPGAPGPANWTMDQYDKECARNAMQFFEWALAEPRVAGIFPWHWDTEADPTAPEGTGLVDLPHCRATYEGIGEIIVNAIADLGANAPPARPPRTEATKTCSGAWHSGYPWCKWY